MKDKLAYGWGFLFHSLTKKGTSVHLEILSYVERSLHWNVYAVLWGSKADYIKKKGIVC